MRLVALFIGSAGAVLILARLLLEAFAGEVNAAFLTTGVAVTITLLWIELYRSRDPSEVNRLVNPARTAYFISMLSMAPTIAHLLVHSEPGASVWPQAFAYPVVLAIVVLVGFMVAHLLCRISFSDAERAADRNRRAQVRRRTVVQ